MSRRNHPLAAILLAAFFISLNPVTARAYQEDVADDSGMSSANIGNTPFTMQGFGNVDVLLTPPPGGHSGFQNGALDLFITSRLDDHWSALSEMVFESSANVLVSDLERFEFIYERSDALRLSAGRVHNPFLRWPITNHHGLFCQTPIDRPIIARWEDEPGLWPMHFVGLLAQGSFGGSAWLNYALGIGNGRGHILDEVQVSSDANDDKAIVASMGASPEILPGFELHVSTYLDLIPADSSSIRERDGALSVSFVSGDWEVRSEWSRLGHEENSSGTHFRTTGWYVLGAYRIRFGGFQPKLYVLAEQLDVPETETFLEGARDEKAWVLGARWDANRWVALKCDIRSSKVDGAQRAEQLRTQLAVNF